MPTLSSANGAVIPSKNAGSQTTSLFTSTRTSPSSSSAAWLIAAPKPRFRSLRTTRTFGMQLRNRLGGAVRGSVVDDDNRRRRGLSVEARKRPQQPLAPVECGDDDPGLHYG